MNKSHLLINEPSLQVLPSLATAIGLNEAIVLQQLHYWLNNAKIEWRREDGFKWVYNTYETWQEDNFPFWSVDKIQRIFLKLEEIGVVVSAQLDAKRRDMKKYYRIDYDKLCAMDDSVLRPSNTAKLHDVKMNQRLPETTNDISLQSIEEQADKKMDAILAFEAQANQAEEEGKAWRGRELLMTDYQPYGDWWHSQTGLHMYGAKGKAKADTSWIKAFKELHENEVSIPNCQAAYNHVIAWKKVIANPLEIIEQAKAFQAAPAPAEPVEREPGKGFYA